MPFLPPNKQRQSTEVMIMMIMMTMMMMMYVCVKETPVITLYISHEA